MGLYIDPTDGKTKEEWLQVHGTQLQGPPETIHEQEGFVPICLVQNPGSFSAAGIAFDERQLRIFKDSRDARPKRWFLAPIEQVIEVQPLLSNVLVTR